MALFLFRNLCLGTYIFRCFQLFYYSLPEFKIAEVPPSNGVYRIVDGKPLFQVVPPPSEAQLQVLLHQSMHRLMKCNPPRISHRGGGHVEPE